jgi:hypothetical protein
MAGKVFGFFAHGFAQPFADDRAIDVVVVYPAFVARVVGRVNRLYGLLCFGLFWGKKAA